MKEKVKKILFLAATPIINRFDMPIQALYGIETGPVQNPQSVISSLLGYIAIPIVFVLTGIIGLVFYLMRRKKKNSLPKPNALPKRDS